MSNSQQKTVYGNIILYVALLKVLIIFLNFKLVAAVFILQVILVCVVSISLNMMIMVIWENY